MTLKKNDAMYVRFGRFSLIEVIHPTTNIIRICLCFTMTGFAKYTTPVTKLPIVSQIEEIPTPDAAFIAALDADIDSHAV